MPGPAPRGGKRRPTGARIDHRGTGRKASGDLRGTKPAPKKRNWFTAPPTRSTRVDKKLFRPAPKRAARPAPKPASRRKGSLGGSGVNAPLFNPKFAKPIMLDYARKEQAFQRKKVIKALTVKPTRIPKYVRAPKIAPADQIVVPLRADKQGRTIAGRVIARPRLAAPRMLDPLSKGAKREFRKNERQVVKRREAVVGKDLKVLLGGSKSVKTVDRSVQRLRDYGVLSGKSRSKFARSLAAEKDRQARAAVERKRTRDYQTRGPGAAYSDVTKWVRKQANDPDNQKIIGSVMGALAGGPTRVSTSKSKGSTRLAVAQPLVQTDAKSAKLAGRVGLNVVKDAVDLPAQTVSSVYYVGKTAGEGGAAAAKGDFKKAGKKGGEAAKMLYEPYVDLAKNPGESFVEHPLVTALMVSGLKGGVGRGTSKALRVAPSKKLRRAGSIMGRAPAATKANTNLKAPRYYSKDSFTKVAQVVSDRRKYGKGKGPVLTPAQIARRVDSTVGRNEGIRRVNRTKVIKAVKAAVGKNPTAATRLAAERIIVPQSKNVEPRPVPSNLVVDGRKVETSWPADREAGGSAATISRANEREGKIYVPNTDSIEASLGDVSHKVLSGIREVPMSMLDSPPAKSGRRSVVKLAAEIEQSKRIRPLITVLDDQGAYVLEGSNRVSALSNLGAKSFPSLVVDARTGAKKSTLLDELKVYRAEVAGGKSGNPAQEASRKELLGQIDSAIKKFDEAKVKSGSEAYVDLSVGLQKQLVDLKMLDPAQARRARLMSYAVRYMGAKYDGEALRSRDGGELSTGAIRAHLSKNNPDMADAAFLTQAPGTGGARNYFVSQSEGPKIGGYARTGEAVRQGFFDAKAITLEENAARAQGLIDAAKGWKNHIQDASLRGPDNSVVTYKSYKEAVDAARQMEITDGIKVVPVRAQPFGGKQAALDELVKSGDQVSNLADAMLEATSYGAGKVPTNATGPWVLQPQAYVARMNEHMKMIGRGGVDPIGQGIGNVFRPLVLSTSPKWLVGNIVEAGLRSGVNRAGPRSWYTMTKVMKKLEKSDPEYHAIIMEEVLGGGHFAMSSRVAVHVSKDRFIPGSKLNQFSAAVGAFARAPGVKLLPQLWHAYTNFVMNTVNRSIERQFQTAMAGKRIRETLMDDDLLKLSDKAISNAAKGIVDVNEAIALGRAVDRAYGRYSKFSPRQRYWVSTYTPFIAWSLNAVRFVYDVLPRDHPVLTGLLAAAFVSSEDWRKSKGLSFWAKNELPGFLQGSIPGESGSHLRASRYTPFGAFAETGGPIGTFGNAFIPQFSSLIDNAGGKDWTGKKLPDQTPTGIAQAMGVTFLGQFVPFFGPTRDIATSKEKELGMALRRRFDPTFFTQNKSSSGSGSNSLKIGNQGLKIGGQGLKITPSDLKIGK